MFTVAVNMTKVVTVQSHNKNYENRLTYVKVIREAKVGLFETQLLH